MKLLAISDTYIPFDFMQDGFAELAELGIDVEVRKWEHPTIEDLQEANLIVETGGPEALTLPEEITANVADFDFVVVQFAPVARALMEQMPKLKAVGVLRGGTENIDVDYATERGIIVLNTPGRNARAVAECTMGMMLTELRNISRSHACLKQGDWRRNFPNSAAIPELYGKTVGLVGYGAVAQLVAGYLQAFGSKIIAFDPYFQGDPSPATLTDLETLVHESDIVSLHARLCEETVHLIGAKEIAMMKPSAVFVNTARSGLVDEKALVKALTERKIMGAALDVFDAEPLPADDPMVGLDNVTITPHLAGSTIDAFRYSPHKMAAHIMNMFNGIRPLPIVNGVEPGEWASKD